LLLAHHVLIFYVKTWLFTALQGFVIASNISWHFNKVFFNLRNLRNLRPNN